MDGANNRRLVLPIGYRFCPNDEDLVNFYLTKKAFGEPVFPNIIPDINFFQNHPSSFPEGGRFFLEKRYFFSITRRPVLVNMHEQIAASSGYWRTKGRTKEIVISGNDQLIGIKNMFVFWEGRDTIQTKTNWVMHEFRLTHRTTPNQLQVADWAVYRLFQEKNKRAEGSDEESSRRNDTDTP
ncbi:hypothetical protein TanjilG_09870 [Lupinus angustifolius]|uniref:NAC domain-containing protein n=1 Tax=Lupinus angustifolius TaxID=3871 RepID=A0A4P1QWK6_LUPAN|nr:PREDICTED: NAC domain-containing protein 83-like [Lupinus angustifolius]OIV96443.1 hypothetical protein TanjilG_09870 [Lupinus angustifolius]